MWIMLLNRKDQPAIRQQEQAQSVSAWLDRGEQYDHEEDYVVCAHNSGDAPVFGCELKVGRPDESEPHQVRFAIIPPGATAVRALPFGQEAMPAADLYSASAIPEFSFTDSHGGHWTRDTSGLLSRTDRRTLRGRRRSATRG
ncbi:hypothetical protein [Amycolatopsis jiangsuensis]|uniref:Uncharacterized protein n=2 Tax=Amycolatopsis jiangsuensis TaxID=1181879 RepID=A0A840IY85_9PSEU|nr:hypothetical protein [Amycolatopsis jiangsuensis]